MMSRERLLIHFSSYKFINLTSITQYKRFVLSTYMHLNPGHAASNLILIILKFNSNVQTFQTLIKLFESFSFNLLELFLELFQATTVKMFL